MKFKLIKMVSKMPTQKLEKVEIGKIMILIKTKELSNKQMLKIMEIEIKLLLINLKIKISRFSLWSPILYPLPQPNLEIFLINFPYL